MIKIIILLSVILNFLYIVVMIGILYILKDQFYIGNGFIGVFEIGSVIGMLFGSLFLILLLLIGQKCFFLKLIILVFIFDS